MDIVENIDLSFEEQCFEQLKRLKTEISEKYSEAELRRRWLKYRLYRHNIYEDMKPHRRERLNKLLRYTLSAIGEHINRNLLLASRSDSPSICSSLTPIRDLSLATESPASIRTQERSRSPSVSSEIIDPIAEIIVVSSDDEEVSESDEVHVKTEPHSPNLCNDRRAQRSVSLGDINQAILNLRNRCNNSSTSSDSSNSSMSLFGMQSSLNRPIALLIVDRSSQSNYIYDKQGVIHLKGKRSVKFNTATLTKQAFILHVIAKVLKLMDSDSYMTKRELYYKSLEFCRVRMKRPTGVSQNCSQTAASSSSQAFMAQSQNRTGSQFTAPSQTQHNIQENKYSTKKLDVVLDDICCLVGCSRVHLRILSQPKGIVFGPLRFRVGDGSTIDCMSKKDGILLPSGQEPITFLESDAQFILVLEKDSVLQKILNQKEGLEFIERYKAVLVTGRGYPDISTRAFLNFLWYKLSIPVLAVTDADPHGLEIVCSYKFGCYKTAHESPGLALPHMKWLGLLPGDVNRLSLPESKTIPQGQRDIRKINSLMTRPYLKSRPLWIKQLQIMRDSTRKAELESLDTTGEYLVKTYLPNKLRSASWL